MLNTRLILCFAVITVCVHNLYPLSEKLEAVKKFVDDYSLVVNLRVTNVDNIVSQEVSCSGVYSRGYGHLHAYEFCRSLSRCP